MSNAAVVLNDSRIIRMSLYAVVSFAYNRDIAARYQREG